MLVKKLFFIANQYAMLNAPAVAAAASSMLNPYTGMLQGAPNDLSHMVGGFDLASQYNPQLVRYLA